jgi:hypothetical protein
VCLLGGTGVSKQLPHRKRDSSANICHLGQRRCRWEVERRRTMYVPHPLLKQKIQGGAESDLIFFY